MLLAALVVVLAGPDDRGPRRPTPADTNAGEFVRPAAGGSTRLVATAAQWDAAVGAAMPGDVIRLTATINTRLIYRGTHDTSGGDGRDGTAEAPIVITSDPGVWIDPGNRSNNVGALDVIAADHVSVIGVRVRNSQFGIRCQQCRGTAAAPVRVSGNVVTDIGHAGIHIAGHWSDHAPSSHIWLEGNNVAATGRIAARYGEGIYIGYGGYEWLDVTSNVTVVDNEISFTGAEGVDVKPGTSEVTVRNNRIHDLAPIDGGAISAHYVNAVPNPHPQQLDRVRVEGNLIWNQNLNGVGGANDWAIWVGHGGVEVVGNLVWGLRNDPSRTRAVRVRATQDFGPHPIIIKDNIFWTARGWVAEMTPSGAGNVQASGNRGADAATNEETVTAADFVGPIPALGAAGTADAGSGPGSGFRLVGAALTASTTTTAPTTAPTTTTASTTAPTTTTTAPTTAPTTTTAPTITASPTSGPDLVPDAQDSPVGSSGGIGLDPATTGWAPATSIPFRPGSGDDPPDPTTTAGPDSGPAVSSDPDGTTPTTSAGARAGATADGVSAGTAGAGTSQAPTSGVDGSGPGTTGAADDPGAGSDIGSTADPGTPSPADPPAGDGEDPPGGTAPAEVALPAVGPGDGEAGDPSALLLVLLPVLITVTVGLGFLAWRRVRPHRVF
ncbi:MAG: right-handed parallel beta-helix repeat-containing protein [Acidimicrobiales bacterium]